MSYYSPEGTQSISPKYLLRSNKASSMQKLILGMPTHSGKQFDVSEVRQLKLANQHISNGIEMIRALTRRPGIIQHTLVTKQPPKRHT
mmetsp:Transcript_12496/g.26546  ORF Transcript_12496/g.26546 Transcript_12496/m.26546 type:complete len:88 (+) Transcript_12496:45-308(+)